MQRVAFILAGMACWVLAVLTVIAWGTTRVQVLIVSGSIGSNNCLAMCLSEGLCFATSSVRPRPGRTVNFEWAQVRDPQKFPSWHELSGRQLVQRSALGYHVWTSSDRDYVQLGVTYPAALISLLSLFAVVRWRTRSHRRM